MVLLDKYQRSLPVARRQHVVLNSTIARLLSIQVKAWEEHVANWVPPEDAKGYVHSTKYVVDYLRTPEELETNPYPWNLQTLCVNSYGRDLEKDKYTYRKPETTARVHCRVLERHQVNPTNQARFGPGSDKPAKYLYTVELTILDDDGSEQKVVVHDVPRHDDGINLFDKAYSQSWHMEHAFRNKMYIPDDIMPESWLNLV
jgi:hypothetical protein